MSRLFDAYIIVDWSAAAKPVTGANSIWVGVLAPGTKSGTVFTNSNPATRLAARQLIEASAKQLIARGFKVLIGFDFALGYPAGTAAALGLTKSGTSPWQKMHDYLAAHVEAQEDNSNTRFALAAKMNAVMTQGPHPFWGTPPGNGAPALAAKKGDFSAPESLPEHRLAEAWIKANFKAHPKSVWQLLGAGAVGSQALLGIPVVHHLRKHLPRSQIWPFQTGLKALSTDDLRDTRCVLAEVYPSTVNPTPEPDEIHDAAQVRTLIHHLQMLDIQGKLASAFGPPNSLEKRKIDQIETEEGWILAK